LRWAASMLTAPCGLSHGTRGERNLCREVPSLSWVSQAFCGRRARRSAGRRWAQDRNSQVRQSKGWPISTPKSRLQANRRGAHQRLRGCREPAAALRARQECFRYGACDQARGEAETHNRYPSVGTLVWCNRYGYCEFAVRGGQLIDFRDFVVGSPFPACRSDSRLGI
jgi:hypothetical protein